MLSLELEWWLGRATDVVSAYKEIAQRFYLEHQARLFVLWLQEYH
jgi:hypothetical protein